MAAPFGLAQRAQRVRGFAGLGNDQQHGVAFQRRVAVVKLVGEFHLDRQVGQFLDQILAHQGRVPTGARGRDDDPLDAAQFRGRHVQASKPRGGAFEVKAPAQRVFDRARLLENLLEHEMRELRPARRPAPRIPAG